ncbi:MAG TPA: peptidoglycan editing factor PgeF [Stellaceae bacterium]|nr:peptidoglycan editing factor PgeF [Stellaceae bacterium]
MQPSEDAPLITLETLGGLPGIRHGFFTREGGVSEGLYRSLNCGFGSGDATDRVAENRARAMRALDLPPAALVGVHQIHSATAVTVQAPWPHTENPRADALVTDRPGVALGILTADCVPVLLADAEARVIGAAHAGWKGALGGVLEATVAAMGRLGARPSAIHAAIGPAIGGASYEVGPEFPDRFLAQDSANARFFKPAARSGHFLCNLPAYVEDRLRRLGCGVIEASGLDTLGDEAHFFSYRRITLRGEADYGRGLSAIALI